MNKPVYFTRAKEEDKFWIEQKTEEKQTLTGEEARDFYQSLVQEKAGERPKDGDVPASRRGRRRTGAIGKRRQEARRPEASTGLELCSSERDGHRLLRCAQEGDTATLKELLRRGCDVNFRDEFYWTAVMCASQAGRVEAVRLLLKQGAAWVGVVDRQGRDARDLALQAGHQDVLRELEECSGVGSTDARSASNTRSVPPQWCEVCGVEYTDSTKTHRCSTLHQFSVLRPPAPPQYCLPSSSASYRMMLRLGWDPSSGLGPAHAGRRNPVSTILKRDHAGLGYGPDLQPKVTHFQSKDPRAVQHVQKEKRLRREKGSKLSAQELKRKEQREKRMEIDYRSSFNFDLSPL